MKRTTKKITLLSLFAATCLFCTFAVASLALNVKVIAEETTTQPTQPTPLNVAKVGDVEYATIDEAIADWTANSTLTLMADVTLSDVITLKSTEHHILDLATYTLTAASGCHAILITAEGVGTAAKSCLTINADSENAGGITATGKSCIYYNNANKINDRLTVTINGGVFNGSYAINSTSGPLNKLGICNSPLRGQGAPYYVINGGTFEAQVYLNAAMLKVTGGTFNKNLTCMGDSTSYRSILGGKFSGMTMTADEEHKFYVGWRETVDGQYVAQYDVGCYVDENGYLVVGGAPITENTGEYQAVSKGSSWNSALEYSSAKDALYYKNAKEALKKKNVTLLVDELDLTGLTTNLSSGSVLLDEDDVITVKFENAKYLPTFKTNVADSTVVYEDVSTENGVTTRRYKINSLLAKVNDTYCHSALDFVNAIEENAAITLYEDIDLYAERQTVASYAMRTAYTEVPDVLTLPNNVSINGNGKTINGTVYTDSSLTFEGDVKITSLYLGANSSVTVDEGVQVSTENRYELEDYTLSLTADKTALKATEALNVTVSIDRAYYFAEYTLSYDTTKFSCAADSNDDGVIFVSNLFNGQAGDLATYTLVAKNDIQSVYEGEVFSVIGNVIQYKEQTLNGIENQVIGDTETIKISLNYTAGVKTDYVQGYSLVLVKGDDAGYAYNGKKMFYVEAYGAYAMLVEGVVTAEAIDAALSKATDCERIRQSYNVNAEYVNDGVIDMKDAAAAYACAIVDFDVTEYMELYLRADVNGDCKVNMVDVNAIVRNYTR